MRKWVLNRAIIKLMIDLNIFNYPSDFLFVREKFKTK